MLGAIVYTDATLQALAPSTKIQPHPRSMLVLCTRLAPSHNHRGIPPGVPLRPLDLAFTQHTHTLLKIHTYMHTYFMRQK